MSGHVALQTAALAAAVTLLVLIGSAGAAGLGAVTVNDVSVSGPAVVSDDDQQLIAGWQAMNVTAAVTTGPGTYDVCAGVGSEAADTFDCRRITGSNTTENVTLRLSGLPENATGEQELVVTVQNANATDANADSLASGTTGVRVLGATGDVDDDGLTNRKEFEVGTAFDATDTDGDGLVDGPEVNTHETDPTSTDTDGDGLGDGAEVNRHGTNPTEVDTDGDGLVDGVEVATHGTGPTNTDTDGDGLGDGVEVNTHQTEPTKADTDGDGLDDGPEVNVHETSPTKPDTDADGVDDGAEVNQYGTNPTEADTDGDGLTDGREINQYGTDPTRADTDGDGVDDRAEATGNGDASSGDSGAVASLTGVPSVVVGALIGGSLALGAALVYRTRGSLWTTSPRERGSADTTVVGADGVGSDHGTETDDTQLVEAMTDEERVHRVVSAHGGQVRQSVVVGETGWSKSKVSRVLSRMADEGAVEKIQIGRENLVTYPDARPDGAASPFDPPDGE